MMVDPIKIATLFIFRVVVRSLCKRQEGAHMPGTSTPRRGATSVSSRHAVAHTCLVTTSVTHPSCLPWQEN